MKSRLYWKWKELACLFKGHHGSLAAAFEERADGEYWGHVCARCRSEYDFRKWPGGFAETGEGE